MFTPHSRPLSQRRYPALALAFALAGCGPEPIGREDIEGKSSALIAKTTLLQRWAPVHYQDVNKGGGFKSVGGKSDYITRFDYEPASNAGDHWNSWDKWDNLPAAGSDLSGNMYVEVSESPTHWFLFYMVYHARDWSTGFDSEHENDAEGVHLLIRKDGTQFGRLEAMVTIAHSDEWTYSADLNTVVPRDGSGRTIPWEFRNAFWRPRTYQEAEGHGVYGCGHPGKTTKCDKPDEDGIRYVPDGWAQTPGTVGVWTNVSYGLRSIDDLWERRGESLMFQTSGAFNGNKSGGCGEGFTVTCKINAANPPWHGQIGRDPAAAYNAKFEFRNVTPPSGRYFKNDFLLCEDLTLAKPWPGHTGQTCNPECSEAIILADPYCGDTAWDGICVSEIETICGSQTSN